MAIRKWLEPPKAAQSRKWSARPRGPKPKERLRILGHAMSGPGWAMASLLESIATSSFSFYETLLMIILQLFYEYSTTTKHQWHGMSQQKGLETHCILGPCMFLFSSLLIINLQIYLLLFNILKTWSSSCSVLCCLSVPILPRVSLSHRFCFFFLHIFRSWRCIIVCYFRSQHIHWQSTATGTSTAKPPRHTRRTVGTLIVTHGYVFFVLLFYILYNGYLC